ncbi:MAG: hypothetical protein ACYTFW_25830 [Planctomycetota bacterium]|jgi:hypothetical protein
MAEKIRFFEGKKFLWDGEEYDSPKKAKSVEKEYSEKGFEVQTWSEDDKVFLYTRRIVTEVVVDNS